jgi:hypothetical protein
MTSLPTILLCDVISLDDTIVPDDVITLMTFTRGPSARM